MGYVYPHSPKVIGFKSNLTNTCSKLSTKILALYVEYLPRFDLEQLNVFRVKALLRHFKRIFQGQN